MTGSMNDVESSLKIALGLAMENKIYPAIKIYEEVLAAQSSILRQLLNSTTLRRILDNEFKAPSDQEPYTLAEHEKLIVDGIFAELKPAEMKGEFTAKKPMISG